MDDLIVFLASPGDVGPERKRVPGVVAEINRLARPGERTLKLKTWEEDVRPGVGEDPQEVVNRQVGDADITIVLFWKRLGTPTHRAESGTVEEFDRAVERWREEPRREVLTYFKTARLDLYADDLEQASKVREFRRRIAATTLSSEISSATEFEARVRTDLTLALRDWALHDAIESPPTTENAERDPEAAFALGLLARQNDRLDEARDLLKRAADQGHVGAMVDLALLIRRGGAPDDADHWFRLAAEHGDSTAIYNVGLRHKELGHWAQAEDWLRRAAELGDVAEKYNLGLVLQKGGDQQEAETWLRRAAEDGDVAAMYNLGLALRDRHELDGAELLVTPGGRRPRCRGHTGSSRSSRAQGTSRGGRGVAPPWRPKWRRGRRGRALAAGRRTGRVTRRPGMRSQPSPGAYWRVPGRVIKRLHPDFPPGFLTPEYLRRSSGSAACARCRRHGSLPPPRKGEPYRSQAFLDICAR